MGGVILLADETQPTLMVLEKKKCVSSKLAHHCYSLPLLLN
jgi:hypothetical protein